MEIENVVSNFNAAPFLFIGSGISRRYLNSPNWEQLLRTFARKVNDDDFKYTSYLNKAESMVDSEDLYPKIAQLIQTDFESKWFDDPSIRTLDENYLQMVKNGLSPFKAEIAMYIKNNSSPNNEYLNEINDFIKITIKSIAGIITTNYDTFLEEKCDGYTTYVGQDELIFSTIQGIAEIYKIHGSITDPDSIIINERDYKKFNDKSAYLASKLMTIFMEHPIIFLGYSISDSNIIKILESILECLTEDKINSLEDRFIFIEYDTNVKDIEITPYTMMISGKSVVMKKVKLSNFSLLYNALLEYKNTLPAKILRIYKEELYNFTLTNESAKNIRVFSIDDTRVDGDELVVALGKMSDFGLKGLRGLTGSEWYRHIIFDDLEFTADELLTYAFPSIKKQYSCLPLNKLLVHSSGSYPEASQLAKEYEFEKIISSSLKKGRKNLKYSSINEICESEFSSLERATRLIACLNQKNIDISDLEIVLKKIFENNKDILDSGSPALKTNIRRLIRIYDYLKWGKIKEPSN